MTRRWRRAVVVLSAILMVALGIASSQLPAFGAGGLLHPGRRHLTGPPPPTCRDATFVGDDVTLKGWQCRASPETRGTIIYLHGVADNRASGAGIIDRFGRRGFDVVAYDSRAHGESGGDACTYGFFEKRDLHRVLDTLEAGPIVLIGTSLGAAVALQEAAQDPRVTVVIGAETFSDLRTVATERAPFFFTAGVVARAMALAEEQGRFQIDAVSPVAAAAAITQPVLLVHGSDDADTRPDHSQRVLEALAGPKRLILVHGARHNESLRGGDVWTEVERWIDNALVERRTSPVEGRSAR
jgi:pimeloyl-ACP methyl ester carboxylesterase